MIAKMTRETEVRLVMIVGQYLADHADELRMIECSDLTGNNI